MPLRTKCERIAHARLELLRCRATVQEAQSILLGEHPTMCIESPLGWLVVNSTLQRALYQAQTWRQVIRQVQRGADIESLFEEGA